MFRSTIGRRAPIALVLAAAAAISMQAAGFASPAGTFGALTPTGVVAAPIVQIPAQQNMGFGAGLVTTAALAPETYAVQVTQTALGTVNVAWAVQTARAVGTLQSAAASVTVVGFNSAGIPVYSETVPSTVQFSTGVINGVAVDTAAGARAYTYSAGLEPVSVWEGFVNGQLTRTTTISSVTATTFDSFAGTDATPAIN
ncbi:MAG TPA: hypothetical protein VN193_02995 [Candidatus Angelobacter sp.]|nr:hypothetical protein [Candidatus Angelobacter sp.]